MKKLSIVVMALMVASSLAFAASLAVPWFVDNASKNAYVPQKEGGVTGIITLKSNVETDLTCYITYFNANGDELGPFPPANSFSIAPKSALAFRPVLTDPSKGVINPDTGVAEPDGGGQEGAQAVLVPDRPLSVNVTNGFPEGVPTDSRTTEINGQTWTLIDRTGDGTTIYQDPVAEDFDFVNGTLPEFAEVIYDKKKNGSCTITWEGGSTDVQGQVSYVQSTDTLGEWVVISYAHLLPNGKES